jgi:ribosomal protein S27AE
MVFPKAVSAKEVACPRCKAASVVRINRSGVWQKLVMASFGIYPWKCGACGVTFLFRHRGYRGLPPGQGRGDRHSRRAA